MLCFVVDRKTGSRNKILLLASINEHLCASNLNGLGETGIHPSPPG
jgi:hypothetical protein